MFPYEITPIDGNEGKDLMEKFKGETAGFVKVGPKKWIFPQKYVKFAEASRTVELKKDDIWLITYAKSGTTWMQEILWLINNNLDYETASKIPLFERFPFFEYNLVHADKYIEELRVLNAGNEAALKDIEFRNTPGHVVIQNIKSPRYIKTHIPLSLLPPTLVDTCKVVYVARNPLDVAVSFYHHCKLFRAHDFQGDFKQFWDLFEKDLALFSPYWEHLKEAWDLRDHPNLLFLFYEDLVRDLPSSIKKICEFLNKSMTEDEIEKLCDFVHIDNLRKHMSKVLVHSNGTLNKTDHGFFRRGKVGGNVEFEDKEVKSRADKWFKENLAKTGIKFPEF